MSALAGFRLAVGMLTVVPVRAPAEICPNDARDSILLSPLAVLPVALIATGLGWGVIAVGLPATLAGLIAVGAMVVGTRAMHADGLSDTTDALGSYRDAEGALAVMKRGDIGPMGTVALILTLGAQAVAIGTLLGYPFGWLQVVVLICVSRGVLVLGCLKGVPAARPGGLGKTFVGTVPLGAAVISQVLLTALACAVGVVAGQPVWYAALGVVVAVAAALWLLSRCVARLGGITGDVLGALVETASTVLLVLALVGRA